MRSNEGHFVKWMAFLLSAWMLVGLQACAQVPGLNARSERSSGESVALLIQGYNYTDDYIDSFTVNGQGGGNLYVSSPTSGGSGSVCCVSYVPGVKLPMKVKVRWTASYCMRQVANPYSFGQRTFEDRIPIWREAEALVDDRSNGHPYALEIHIYQDGHVEGSVTRGESPPRVVLPRDEHFDRPGIRHVYPNCSDDILKSN